jgi:hypothetical protein
MVSGQFTEMAYVGNYLIVKKRAGSLGWPDIQNQCKMPSMCRIACWRNRGPMWD